MRREDDYLNTWEFGLVRIVEESEIPVHERREGLGYIRDDDLGEWSYWQLASGEVVAVHNWED